MSARHAPTATPGYRKTSDATLLPNDPSSYNGGPHNGTRKMMKTRKLEKLPLFAVVDLRFVFHDVTGKPFNCDKAMVRQLNRMIDTCDHLIVELPIHILRATQARVNDDFRDAAARHVRGTDEDFPAVVKHLGLYYVTDGHHRIVCRHHEGCPVVTVRLFDLDGDTQTDMPLIDFLEG